MRPFGIKKAIAEFFLHRVLVWFANEQLLLKWAFVRVVRDVKSFCDTNTSISSVIWRQVAPLGGGAAGV